MSKHFNVFRQIVLGYILIVGLCVGLITPVAQAEAPIDNSYSSATGAPVLVDGLTVDQRADKIDAFFASRGDLPLIGYGHTMVEDADKYGIDWKLVAGLSYNESTAGLHECPAKHGVKTYNAFGYDGCDMAFKSYADAIDTVSRDLAGQIPATAKAYANKSIAQIINTYNPPSANPDYKSNVLWTMNKIASTDITSWVASAPSASQLAIK